jgi:hypothetical protein
MEVRDLQNFNYKVSIIHQTILSQLVSVEAIISLMA